MFVLNHLEFRLSVRITLLLRRSCFPILLSSHFLYRYFVPCLVACFLSLQTEVITPLFLDSRILASHSRVFLPCQHLSFFDLPPTPLFPFLPLILSDPVSSFVFLMGCDGFSPAEARTQLWLKDILAVWPETQWLRFFKEK